MNNIDKRTDFLFKRRGFFTGFSSVLSIAGDKNKFNTSKSGKEADKKAIRSDWEMIGNDIRKTLVEMF